MDSCSSSSVFVLCFFIRGGEWLAGGHIFSTQPHIIYCFRFVVFHENVLLFKHYNQFQLVSISVLQRTFGTSTLVAAML